MEKYSEEIEKEMQLYCSSLSERSRRHYGSLEARKLGFGGKAYISKLLNLSPKTLLKGDKELKDSELYNSVPAGRQRRSGGGRKKFCSS
jgi:hypothetical protein